MSSVMRHSLETLLILIIAIGVFYYFEPAIVTNIFNSVNPYYSPSSTTTISFPTNLPAISIGDTSSTRTLNYNNSAEVTLTGQYDTISVYLSSNSTLYLNIVGNYNTVYIYGGSLALQISGNHNSINRHNTVLVSRNLQGQGNVV